MTSYFFIFFFFFIILFYFFLREFITKLKLARKGIITTGKITGVKEERDLDNVLIFQMIISFETFSKEKFEFISNMSTYEKEKLPESVRVIYNPASPELAEVYDFSNFWLKSIFLVIGSILFLIASFH